MGLREAGKIKLLRERALSEIAAAFLVDYAFATNSAGVTLFSMFQKEHLDFNLRRLENNPTSQQLHPVVALLRANPAAGAPSAITANKPS